jgi:hypothetical protein
MSKQFLAGAVIGVPLAVVGLVFGIPGMVATFLMVMAVGWASRLPMVLAGGLIGVGATWLLLFGNAVLTCAAPDRPCGSVTVAPLLAVAGATAAAIGLLVVAAEWRSASRRT